ncbi:hypothetical protein Pcinc_032213 [Petrolisthes cinctipes]|uniref:Uncharacterized protein n=1 Tax=Petrolisthes cinctipes TaxID=88211 RepID=A0AAE1JZK7_PETCI|nr:hypothetical protein Pcinc_032213 [Petrolisthes cinctipes]
MTSSDLDGDSHGVGGEGATGGGGGVGTRIGPGDALVAPICTPPPGTLFSTNTNTNTYNNNEIPATPPTLSSLLFDHLNNTLSSTLDLTLSLNNNNNNSSPYSSIPSPSSYLDLNQSLTSPSSSSFFVSSSPSPSRLCRDGNCTTAEPPESTIIKPTIISPLLLSLTGITGHIWALCYLHGTSPRNASRTVFHTLLLALIWTDFLGKIATTVPAVHCLCCW